MYSPYKGDQTRGHAGVLRVSILAAKLLLYLAAVCFVLSKFVHHYTWYFLYRGSPMRYLFPCRLRTRNLAPVLCPLCQQVLPAPFFLLPLRVVVQEHLDTVQRSAVSSHHHAGCCKERVIALFLQGIDLIMGPHAPAQRVRGYENRIYLAPA